MASESSEDAAGDVGPNGWEEEGGYGGAEHHQSSLTEHHSQHQPVQEPHASVDPDSSASGDSSEDVDEDSGGEYDPESVEITTTAAPEPAPQPTPSPRPSKKPKKAGGFIVGSSDDEDDSPANNAANTLKPNPPAEVLSRSFSHSPSPHSTSVPQDAGVPSHGGNPVAQVSFGKAAAQAAVANPTVTMSRLPTDVVGQLEARVKDDPRGELDAWLALIDEHRKRNMIPETRAVYERFFAVFPQSVSCLDSDLCSSMSNVF